MVRTAIGWYTIFRGQNSRVLFKALHEYVKYYMNILIGVFLDPTAIGGKKGGAEIYLMSTKVSVMPTPPRPAHTHTHRQTHPLHYFCFSLPGDLVLSHSRETSPQRGYWHGTWKPWAPFSTVFLFI